MDTTESTIYYLKNDDILNKEILNNYIYTNMNSNYYWSEDFSEEFYINLAVAGFICVSTMYDDKLLLFPELQYEYAVLDFENLHISKKVKKLINNNEYKFTINENFDELLLKINTYHDDCWLRGEYLNLIKKLKNYKHNKNDFEILSVELKCKNTDELIAGELGYKIGTTYTSLTGFCKRDKRYNNWGNLQLVLLALYLQKNDFTFWNLGHASMPYKQKLGAQIYSREDFLVRWLKDTQNKY